MTRSKTVRASFIFAAALATVGCSASINTHVVEPVPPSPTALVAVLGVMPATAEPGSEGLTAAFVTHLEEALQAAAPEIEMLGPDAAAERLAAQGLAGEYARLLADFDRAGMVDRAETRRIAEALGVSHFLHVRVAYSGQNALRPYVNLDGTPLLNEEKRQVVQAVARLWADGAATPSWEAVATADSQAGLFRTDRSPDDLANEVVRSLVARLSAGRFPQAGGLQRR